MIGSTPAARTKAEKRWLKVFRTLNEFQARLLLADKALDLGRGGISRMSQLTGMSRTTITKAVQELQARKALCVPPGGVPASRAEDARSSSKSTRGCHKICEIGRAHV